MKPLMFNEKDAKELYPTASPVEKRALENTFGKEFFSQKPTDRIKTFEDACEALDMDPDSVFHEEDEADEIAYKKLKVITKALNFLANNNEVWIPDYDNSSQPKWKAWWYLNKSGFRLGDVFCAYANSRTGARLDFKTEELARYAASQFSGLYSDFIEYKL